MNQVHECDSFITNMDAGAGAQYSAIAIPLSSLLKKKHFFFRAFESRNKRNTQGNFVKTVEKRLRFCIKLASAIFRCVH